MKKLTLISAALIGLGMVYTGQNTANAQGVVHKLSFGLNVGCGIPGGDFSKNDGTALPIANAKGADTTKYNGFAKTGFHFNIYANYMFSTNVGATIVIGGTMNTFDAATLQTVANTNNTGSPAVVTSSGNYYVGQYLIGPYFAFPLGSDKVSLELKGLVGLVTANYPTIDYAEGLGTGSIAVKSGSGFGYSGVVGLKYMLTDMFGLHLDVGYLGSSISYSSSTQTQSYAGMSQSYTDPVSKTMSLSLIQVTIGASVDL